jgi:UDP-GlcNAc:undecaprenyl-phosphate GlcNAc-1-phosphate transferase
MIMTYIIQIVSAFIIGAFMVFVTIPMVVRVSKAKKLFDIPDERKVNKRVIPNLGGVSLFIGISIATLLCLGKLHFPEFRPILVGMIILFFIGIKDDILIISARKKFTAQIICSLIVIILGNIRFTNLHGILGINEIDYGTSLFISTIAIAGIINAVNLIDGIDGLASSLGILISLVFGLLFLSADNLTFAIFSFAVAGSLFMFFFFNVYGKINKIFMGDTGSLILGLVVAVFVIKYNELTLTAGEQVMKLSPALTMAIISVPMFDMIRVFFIRIRQRKSPFFPDMNHIHHKFLKLGYSHLKTTLILTASNLFLIGFALLTLGFNNHLQMVLLISVAVASSYIPDIIFKYRHLTSAYPKKVFTKFVFLTSNDILKQDYPRNDYLIGGFNKDSKSEEKESEKAIGF